MKKFKTTLIDPPWEERGGGGRGAQYHYPVMKIPQIISTVLTCPIWNPADDAHLYLWTTNTFLPQALSLIPVFGFTYKTMVTWEKPRISIGQYFRGKTEHMLFAIRGSGYAVRTDIKNLPTIIQGDNDQVHSRKPLESYQLVEKRSDGPYAEIFSRRKRRGWTVWGNEV